MAPDTTTKDEMDMDLLAEDKDHYAEPPARIAARFHQKSGSRRRSSTHSSRCSSLSSRHSRSSALSCHGGPRSTHIAQHLRRASIIESRKARLADRALHAEQVRLRAAAALAASRATYSEEKALAAQAAREKLLAEITARCQEEVRRAKQVARETKAREAAEHARRREELEEKFAEAAKRRSLYQSTLRRPRTTSLAAVEERKVGTVTFKRLTQTAAANVIQRTWRVWRRRRIAEEFLKTGLATTRQNTISFKDMTRLIAEEHVIDTAKLLLKQLDLLDAGNEDTADRGAARVFLSAFMIVSHPEQALSHGGQREHEQQLVIKGRAFLELFAERLSTEAASGSRPIVSKQSQEQLQFAFNDYNAAFHAWKTQDLTVLIDVMVGSFVNLDLIIQTTKGDTDGFVAEDYLQAIRQEQIKLLARLKRLAGPEQALSRVRTAVRRARKERASSQKKTQPAQHVPRSTSDSEVTFDVPVVEPMTPPATPTPSRFTSESPRVSSLLTRLGQTMTVLPSNREIAHEILVNGMYEIQQQPWTNSRRLQTDALQQNMRDSIRSGDIRIAATWINAMAMLIRDKMLSLLSSKHPLYQRVDNLLDLKLIEQQSLNNVFSYESFFERIGNLISQLCSPGRDDIVKAFNLDTSSDNIDRLFSLINILDLMTLDHVNFQFRMASKAIMDHGHEHEYSMFEHDLREGKNSLDRTKQWWQNAKSNVSASGPYNASYGTMIYSRGLVDLVLSNSSLQYSSLPETLQLDWTRILELRARSFHIVAAASMLLTTKIRLRRNREEMWASDAERLRTLGLTHTDAPRIVSMLQSSHMMPDTTKSGLLNFVGRVLPSATAALQKSKLAEQDRLDAIRERQIWDPNTSPSTNIDDVFTEQISTYILKSLREHVFARLSASSTAERVRVTTGAAEVLARIGMPEFVADVGSIVEALERVRAADLRSHGKWYDEVAGGADAAARGNAESGVATGANSNEAVGQRSTQ